MDNLPDLAGSLPSVDTADIDYQTPSSTYVRDPPCSSPRVVPTVRQRNFMMQTHDAMLHFQILDLGRQYYVWVSAVGPKLDNMYLAIKTPADAAPAVASLLPGTPGEGPAVAQRLALKLGKPVVCSFNMPINTPLLQAVTERRVLTELQAMAAEVLQSTSKQEEDRQTGHAEMVSTSPAGSSG